MAQDMEGSYAALRNMAENTPSVNKKLVGEKEMHRARALLREYKAKGYRIDGAPATASIYGVMPRKTAPAPSEPSKEEIKAGLLAELAPGRRNARRRGNVQSAMQKLISVESLKGALDRLTKKQAQMVFDRKPPAEIASVGTRIEELRRRLKEAEEKESIENRRVRG